MLDQSELLSKIIEYAKNHETQGRFLTNRNDLWKYTLSIDPKADIRNMDEVINELDSRGWLLFNTNSEIEFDPATF